MQYLCTERLSSEIAWCQVVVLEKIVQRGFHAHLEDLLVRLSFNHYYSNQARTAT